MIGIAILSKYDKAIFLLLPKEYMTDDSLSIYMYL